MGQGAFSRAPKAPSRRAALTGLAALMATGPAAAQTAPGPGPDQIAALATRSDSAQRLTIEVMLNGAGPFRFIVDTGAERSVIADDVAARLGLASVGRVVIDGIVRKIPADLVAVKSLAYGPFSLDDVQVPVLPRQYLLVDGYLGLDAISDKRVTFDFQRRQLRIDGSRRRLEGYVADQDIIRVVVRGTAGRLRANHCWVDGVAASAFVDSGAEVSMGNSALRAALEAKRSHVREIGPIILTGVTGGETHGQVIAVKRIHLQEMNVENDVLAISDTASFAAWGLADQPALLLGMNFLRQFARVSIDYRRAEIRFDLSLSVPPMQIASA